jgi:LemA protein
LKHEQKQLKQQLTPLILPRAISCIQLCSKWRKQFLSRLLVTVEQYPELKANENFLKLQDELASTENQILTSRTRFNEAVKPYNTHIKTSQIQYLQVLDLKKTIF